MLDGKLEPVPANRCMRWHGITMRLCECFETGQPCPPQARRTLPKLTEAQITQVLSTALHQVHPVHSSYTGDICDQCGGARIIRTGTCATCTDCGTSVGGCS